MRLGFVGIRNYRGIRSLALPIDPVTALIGENAYGKSNLLDALLACLGPGADDGRFSFSPEDVGEDPSAPMEFELGFRESTEGEWEEDPRCGPIRPHVYLSPNGNRRVSLRVRARPAPTRPSPAVDPPQECAIELLCVDGRGEQHGPVPGPALVELLRERCPFLLLKADRYFTRPSRSRRIDTPTRPVSLEDRLAAEITDAYEALMRPHEPDHDVVVRGGLHAARAYVERFGGERLRERVRHFLPSIPYAATGTGVSLAARSMALMLVLGALLDARAVQTFGPGAFPIIAIEDAEANLHPVLLAAVANIIDAIPAQKLITTNSGDLLSMLPLPALRRLVRTDRMTRVHRLERTTLAADELRRVGFHVKANRGSAFFARAWLLVEGETEFWLMPQFTELVGCDLAVEGIRIMEFAQCGVAPLIKLADDLGIGWHLLADGDSAGNGYAQAAVSLLGARPTAEHVTRLDERDLEHALWHAGYADVYRNAVRITASKRFAKRPKVENPTPTIERAIRARSKPGMAVEVAEAARDRGPEGVPPPIRHAIEATVRLARQAASQVPY
jgi:putative ATP-dependent endonuclease of the OLD family